MSDPGDGPAAAEDAHVPVLSGVHEPKHKLRLYTIHQPYRQS